MVNDGWYTIILSFVACTIKMDSCLCVLAQYKINVCCAVLTPKCAYNWTAKRLKWHAVLGPWAQLTKFFVFCFFFAQTTVQSYKLQIRYLPDWERERYICHPDPDASTCLWVAFKSMYLCNNDYLWASRGNIINYRKKLFLLYYIINVNRSFSAWMIYYLFVDNRCRTCGLFFRYVFFSHCCCCLCARVASIAHGHQQLETRINTSHYRIACGYLSK